MNNVISENHYRASVIHAFPGNMPRLDFSDARPRPGPGGLEMWVRSTALLVEVHPTDGTPWVGSFAGDAEGVSGVFCTPNEGVVCVIAVGAGYWVPVNQPKRFAVVPIRPIKRVMTNASREMMIFVSYDSISAFGRSGFLWVARDLSWDGVSVTNFDSEAISGTGWDAPHGRDVQFRIDVKTGEVEGGASPKTTS